MDHTEPLKQQSVTEIEQAIKTALTGLRYGSIEILIHDSKVVQIERKERVRFTFDRLRSPR